MGKIIKKIEVKKIFLFVNVIQVFLKLKNT